MARLSRAKMSAKRCSFKKSIDDRRKKLVTAGRGDGVPAAELRPYLSAVFVTVPVRGHGAGLTAFHIRDSFGLAFVHDGHERVDAVETAREARIGIELYQHFLDFVDRQSCIQTFVQRAFQFFQIAVGREDEMAMMLCCFGFNCFGFNALSTAMPSEAAVKRTMAAHIKEKMLRGVLILTLLCGGPVFSDGSRKNFAISRCTAGR